MTSKFFSVIALALLMGSVSAFTGVKVDDERSNANLSDGSFVLLNVNVKVWLEGAYMAADDSMSTDLTDSGTAPTSQPFSDSFYDGSVLEYDTGTESVGGSWPTGEGTDWVLVELRTGSDPSTMVSQKAAVVRSDGLVVEASDLSSQVVFSGVPATDYYIVVRHRNHLPLMTANVVALTTGPMTLYDFTTAQGQAFGTNPMKELETGVYGMYAGNGNLDAFVTSLDFNAYLPDERSAATGYKITDYNLDSFVTSLDFNEYLPNERAAAASSID